MTQVSFDPILADAYRQAALEGRDMYAFASQMERVKTTLQPEKGLYKQWERLDDLIGSMLTVSDDPEQVQLVRGVFIRQLETVFTAVILAPGGNATAKWRRWLEVFSEASFHWRIEALDTLCEAPALREVFGEKLEPYRELVGYFKDRRWVETRAVFAQLAGDTKLPNPERGYHYYVCGQIDLYFHYQYEQAYALFEKARKLLDGKPLAFHGLIEYYMKGPEKDKDLDRALALAEEALTQDPNDVPTIIQKADVLLEKGELGEAEKLYRMASSKRPGNTLCYTRLIDLYGKPGMFENKEPELAQLLEFDTRLDPVTNYLTRTDLGVVYQNQDSTYWPKAEQYHREATDQYSEGFMASLNLGYFYLDISKEYDKARPIFEAVLRRAPEAREGYLAMGRLHEAESDWKPAIENYEKVQSVIPSWARFIQATIGRCYRMLGDLDAAEKALLRAWELDEYDDSGALAEIYEVAQKWYKDPENPQPDRAHHLLERTAALQKGKAATAAGIANRQGHVYYYIEQYTEALPFYRKAAELDGSEAVYFTNQFDCLENLYRQTLDTNYYDQALEALNQASGVAPQDSSIPKKRRQLALIQYNPHLVDVAQLTPVHVEVGQPLLDQITKDFQSLLPEMSELTEALRERVRLKYAIGLPGIRYRDIAEEDGAYQFRLYETPVVYDRLALPDNQPPTMAAVLDRLEIFFKDYCLDLFVNYWDVDKEVPLLPNDELIHFTRVVMTLLAEQTPLPPLPELHQHYRRLEGARLPVLELVEQLRLHEAIRSKLPGVQESYRYIFLGEKEERALSGCLVGAGDTRALAFPHDYARLFLGAVIRRVQDHQGEQVALVTRNKELRACLRGTLAALPGVPILKESELPSGAAGRTLAPLEVSAEDNEVFNQALQQLRDQADNRTTLPNS